MVVRIRDGLASRIRPGHLQRGFSSVLAVDDGLHVRDRAERVHGCEHDCRKHAEGNQMLVKLVILWKNYYYQRLVRRMRRCVPLEKIECCEPTWHLERARNRNRQRHARTGPGYVQVGQTQGPCLAQETLGV